MIIYKIRRKSDGLFARSSCQGISCSWGKAGATYSQNSLGHAANLYNSIGGARFERLGRVFEPFSNIELVMFDVSSGTEKVLATEKRIDDVTKLEKNL